MQVRFPCLFHYDAKVQAAEARNDANVLEIAAACAQEKAKLRQKLTAEKARILAEYEDLKEQRKVFQKKRRQPYVDAAKLRGASKKQKTPAAVQQLAAAEMRAVSAASVAGMAAGYGTSDDEDSAGEQAEAMPPAPAAAPTATSAASDEEQMAAMEARYGRSS